MRTGEEKALAAAKRDHKAAKLAAEPEIKAINTNVKAYHGLEGGSWIRQDVEKLRSEGRPALDLNKIKPAVNMILGLEADSGVMMRVYPERSEDSLVAAALDALGNRDWYNQGGEDLRAEMFGMAVIGRRGHIGFVLDVDSGIAEHKMIPLDPRDVLIDPSSTKFSPDKDANYVCFERWFHPESLASSFPDHRREIMQLATTFKEGNKLMHPPFKQRQVGDDYTLDKTDMMRYDHRTGRLETVEVVRRESDMVFMIVDTQTQMVEEFDTRAERNEALEEIERDLPDFAWRFVARTFRAMRMQRTIFVGGQILIEHGKDNRPTGMGFPLSTMRCHHHGRITTSVVDDLIDPQRQHNVTWSNILYIMSSVAHSGWAIPTQSGQTKEYFDEHGAETGFNFEFQYPFKPEKLQADAPSMAHWLDVDFTDRQMKEISGARDTLRGEVPGDLESGVGVSLIQRAGLATLATLYANLVRADRETYEKHIYMIQEFMPVPEEVEILGDRLMGRIRDAFPEDAIMASAGQKFLRMSALGGINDFRALDYKVRVEQGPVTRSQKEYYFQTAMQLAQVLGPEAMPPELLVEFSDFPFKQEIIEYMQQRQEMMQEAQATEAGASMAAAALSQGG